MQVTDDVRDIKRCVNGDPKLQYTGLITRSENTEQLAEQTHKMVCELYHHQTGNEPPTDRQPKKSRWDELQKYVYMGVGIVGTLVFLLPLIWDKLFP